MWEPFVWGQGEGSISSTRVDNIRRSKGYHDWLWEYHRWWKKVTSKPLCGDFISPKKYSTKSEVWKEGSGFENNEDSYLHP